MWPLTQIKLHRKCIASSNYIGGGLFRWLAGRNPEIVRISGLVSSTMKKLRLEELGRISVGQFKNADKLAITVLLDNVRSLHNVGSAFRTADAFRLEKIVLTGITGTPPHREIHKTALGATESVSWEFVEDPSQAVTELRKNGYQIIAVEQTDRSTPLHKFQPQTGARYCLVFGNEVNGVSDSLINLADDAIEIPQSGTKHSLNISVCLGVVAWEMFRKIQL
jgi:23S rRNA (guanosine2251-2'-O)-methyltransferase